MANLDRPNGLKPVKTLSGAAWKGAVRSIGVADGADIFVGDPINLESGLAAPGATNDAAFLGVAVGFGKFVEGLPVSAFDPANLDNRFYDDSASTHTEWCCFYVPADDMVFEAQTATALTMVVGDTCDLSYTAGNAVTGISACELTTNSNADFTVVEIPRLIDNDTTAVWGRYNVMFTRAEQAFHG
jgi:hypothetical protein